jgi:FkbM family methyltransferase
MNDDERRRVNEAGLCHDAEYIPKVPEAGHVRVDEKGNRVQLMHNGLVVAADGYYGNFVTQIIERMRGHHEPQEERAFYEVLKVVPPGSTMIELGAYWAYYSLWFQKAVPGASNFMIEPAPAALKCGMRNFELNGMRGDFTLAYIGQTSSEGWQKAGLQSAPEAVGRVCVKDFVCAKGIDRVTLLHSDIQGFEYDMLRGCGELVDNRKISFLFISTHSLKVHFQCRRHLVERGYTLIAEHTPKESYSEDGLIVAAAAAGALSPVAISKRPVSARQKFKAAFFKLTA